MNDDPDIREFVEAARAAGLISTPPPGSAPLAPWKSLDEQAAAKVYEDEVAQAAANLGKRIVRVICSKCEGHHPIGAVHETPLGRIFVARMDLPQLLAPFMKEKDEPGPKVRVQPPTTEHVVRLDTPVQERSARVNNAPVAATGRCPAHGLIQIDESHLGRAILRYEQTGRVQEVRAPSAVY